MSTGTGTETERALAFLAAHQLSSGQFGVLMGSDLSDPSAEAWLDSTPFPTALIVHSLGLSDSEVAAEMIRRAVSFLRAEMEPGGVWRYWTAEHERHRTIPADLDDTACVAQVLRRHGVPVPGHRSLLLANRDHHGLFYTWITPRWRPPPPHWGFWRVALKRYRTPVSSRMFWRLTESAPGDVDGVVNANVLFYLGESAQTAPIVAHLVDVIRRGDEGRCDKWHLNPFTFHYMVARCFAAGAESLRPVRDEAIERIVARSNADGSIGTSALDTALAACALRSWSADNEAAERATDHLRVIQRADGGWPVVAMYWGGPNRYYGWGSEELTTGYCLEALLRCSGT
jgi:hypothetical protein